MELQLVLSHKPWELPGTVSSGWLQEDHPWQHNHPRGALILLRESCKHKMLIYTFFFFFQGFNNLLSQSQET